MSDQVEAARLELEQTDGRFQPQVDRRPLMPEPLPVKLVAVEDVRGRAAAGLEEQLDGFYVEMLQFERDDRGEELVYRAENFRLIMEVVEPPMERPDMRPIVVEVRSLAEAEAKLVDREMEYSRQRGINAGERQLVVQDPAGNWVSIVEGRRLM